MAVEDRCLCRACGLTFQDVEAFDAHRMGNFELRGANRKCVPLEALRGAGLKLIDPKNPDKGWRL